MTNSKSVLLDYHQKRELDAAPEWVVELKGRGAPQVLPFEAIREVKQDVLSMTLLWTENSYHINVEKGYFIINGGRWITAGQFKNLERKVLYYRRHTFSKGVGMEQSNGHGHLLTYLLGIEGWRDGELVQQIMLQISDTGRQYRWRDSR